jgi:hypothetical protein
MLGFNTLLQEAGFDFSKVFLLRHEDKRVKFGVYQAWKSAPKDLEAYQSNQQWKNRFEPGFSLAAFVVGPERETLFVGMYDVLKLDRLNEEFNDPLLGKMPAGDRASHELKHSDRMQEYEEKVVIEWGKGKLAWRQRASQKNNKIVLEIRAQAKEEAFNYVTLLRPLEDLRNIYPSWQTRLKALKGVYLLTFDDGMQYVGSATGEEGFWQRWQDYLTTGHGGNRILIRDQRDARNATVSILEVSGSAQTGPDIINQEMLWQLKLGTRAKRLESVDDAVDP